MLFPRLASCALVNCVIKGVFLFIHLALGSMCDSKHLFSNPFTRQSVSLSGNSGADDIVWIKDMNHVTNLGVKDPMDHNFLLNFNKKLSIKILFQKIKKL